MGRTPIAAILSSATIDGVHWPLVAERFATSDDAYLALGIIPADPMCPGASMWPDAPPSESTPLKLTRYDSDADTADGRPRTLQAARARLARMLGEDCERLVNGEVESLARQVVHRQAHDIAQAIAKNLPTLLLSDGRPLIMISGHGSPLALAALAQLPLEVDYLNLSERISPSAARCAPAVAVARLLEEHLYGSQVKLPVQLDPQPAVQP
ncbi:MAG: hypothetical protein ABI557_09410, partial [Aureliella sp.]